MVSAIGRGYISVVLSHPVGGSPRKQRGRAESRGIRTDQWTPWLSQVRSARYSSLAIAVSSLHSTPCQRWSSLHGLPACCFGIPNGKKNQEPISLKKHMNQIRSVAQSCPTLCYPMNLSTPGHPVHHQLPEFTQTHVHRVSDDIQPSHPVVPFSSCPQSLPASESFPMSQLFA